MRRVGDGTETTVEQALMRGVLPHDRGFVLGLPRSRGRASIRSAHNRARGFPTAFRPRPCASAWSMGCCFSGLHARTGVTVRAMAQMKPTISRGDRRRHHHPRLSRRHQMPIALAHPQLTFPGDVANGLGNASIRSCSFRLTRACIR